MPAPNRTVTGFTHIVGGSDYGACIKASVARLLGYEELPTSERMQALYDAGNEHEEECVAALNESPDWAVYDRQREYVIDCGDGWGVVVHPDGLCHYDPAVGEMGAGSLGAVHVLEIKSPSTWHSFERAVRTATFTDPYVNRIAWQTSAEMVSTDKECVVACLENGQVRTFGIEVPIYTREQIVARVQAIRWAAAEGVVPKTCTSADYPCSYAYLHEDPPCDVDPELDELGLQRARLISERKSLDLGIKDVEEAMKAHCGGRNVKTELVSVTTYTQAGPAKWDEKAMLADGVEVDKYWVTGKSSVRTRITQRGE